MPRLGLLAILLIWLGVSAQPKTYYPDADWQHRSPGYRYLRAKGNSIEGGTSEILANIIAERVLGLPAEPRTDTTVAWKDLPR